MVRIGQSTDIHALIEGRPLILGGVTIDYPLGLLGHSDADVLLHAICEALIGAMGLGDIGKHFPDTDATYKGISSMILLEKTWQLMDNEGYQLVNLDSLLLIEKPKIAPYIDDMKKNISKVLRCELSQVNVKATRGEKLGFIGRQEGVMAQAIVLLERKL
ncbi:MAG: 2-C-methyl-D-erythritol 2,4-cyclodiphosphate synthase [Erysipelotrichaceae bacterium]|nr:2-C-methyl-D-erythritol 2,4-cyclodiphosphate synthase [Erysipelotrichaceae bacterium]MDP3305754.1 2-C-methyl-D-erythritol 2,4-cyclodiphosphate synthase [Erysipelotrichaceae bacterium]